MKKLSLFFVAFFVFATSLLAQKGYETNFSQPNNHEYLVSFSVTEWNLSNVVHGGVNYQQINFGSSAVTQETGWAELPFISASVQLPARKNVDLSVINTEFTDYQLDFPLVPSRGTILRSQDPNTIPYQIAPESIMDRFYPSSLAYADEPFIIRDVRGTSVRVFPFQYNSATNTLRVFTKMDVLLTENNQPATNPLLNENPNPIREARGMYKSLFINYQEPRIPLWMADHGDILVITTARDETAIQPYIDWKKQKGYKVEKSVVLTSNTATEIKNLIQGKYNANNNLMYVLLVGDWADIKSESATFGTLGTGPTDPILGDVTGTSTQYRPDIAVGRMSASSAAHVTTQVNKTIQYEKNPNMEAAWYSTFAGLGSNDGSGGDDGEKDHTHIINIYDYRLVPKYSYNQHKGFYDYNSTASASALATAINNGVSTIAYCGHGSSTSFVTTGFSNSNVNALTNGTKLPFIVSVACVNGAFHESSDCFAEAWLKKDNGGAVITWMSTINQPWNEPMRGQDYFYDVLTGGYNYTTQPGTGISTDELRTHWGAIAVNAANLMLNESNLTNDIATVRTWCTFGDPNLQLRTKQPAVLASSSDMMIVGMPFETTITANGSAVKDALVCISQNGVYKSAYTNAAGFVSIANEFTPGEVLLVVTGFNTNTIYSNIMCIAPAGPYVINGGYSVVGAEELTYISTNQEIEVTLKNVGVEATSGTVTATITCEDPQLTIVTGTTQFTTPIAPDGTATVKFKVTVAHDIVDGKTFPLDLAVTSTAKNDPWESKLTLKAYAPEFKLTKILVDDVENGSLPKGSLARITAVVENKGGADAFDVVGDLDFEDQYVLLACEDAKKIKFDLPAGENKELNFYIVTNPDMTSGYEATLNLLLEAKYGRSYETPFKVSNATVNNYCIPVLSTGCTANDKFTAVKLYKQGTTNYLIDHAPPCSSPNGYGNHTNMAAQLEAGVTYKVDVTVGAGGLQYIKGWIDYNGVNQFETSELIFSGSCNANGSTSFTFTLPSNFVPGEQRFRLRCQWNTAPTDACSGSTWGQTLDYTVVLPELYPKVQNVEAELEDLSIIVTWEEPEVTTTAPIGYNIYRDGNKLNEELLTELSYTETDIEDGVYAYNVRAVYTGDKESFAVMSNVICYTYTPPPPPVCNAPENLEVTAEGKTALLKWDEPEIIDGTIEGYNIYKDGVKINEDPVTETEYSDENLAVGTYYYQVSVITDLCDETEKTDSVSVTIVYEYCEPPVNFEAYQIMEDKRNLTVLLTWEEPEKIDGVLLGYNVQRDSEIINEELVTELTYTDELDSIGEYVYQVSAVYEHCESDFTDPILVNVVESGIKNVQNAFSIYPNPTTGELTIDNGQLTITNVEIYDAFGKKQLSIVNCQLSINISHLSNGIYFVKITTETGVVTKKVIKH